MFTLKNDLFKAFAKSQKSSNFERFHQHRVAFRVKSEDTKMIEKAATLPLRTTGMLKFQKSNNSSLPRQKMRKATAPLEGNTHDTNNDTNKENEDISKRSIISDDGETKIFRIKKLPKCPLNLAHPRLRTSKAVSQPSLCVSNYKQYDIRFVNTYLFVQS